MAKEESFRLAKAKFIEALDRQLEAGLSLASAVGALLDLLDSASEGGSPVRVHPRGEEADALRLALGEWDRARKGI